MTAPLTPADFPALLDRIEAAEAEREQERLEKGQAVLALMDLRRTSVVAEECVTLRARVANAEAEVSRLRGQVEGAWRAGVEAAANASGRHDDKCNHSLCSICRHRAAIRALPPPTAPAGTTT